LNAKINPLHPDGLVPWVPERAYDLPKQMRAPLILENQKDGNFDDMGHFDDFKSFWNPFKAAGPMHAQISSSQTESVKSKLKTAVKQDKKNAPKVAASKLTQEN